MQLVARKRIDILADAPLLPRLEASFMAAGIAGHTVFPAVSGSGRHGRWESGDLSGASAKLSVMAIAAEDAVDQLVSLLSPLLDSHRLLLTVSDVAVVRGDRF